MRVKMWQVGVGALGLVGCTATDPGFSEPEPEWLLDLPEGFTDGGEVVCTQPRSGFVRLVDDTAGFGVWHEPQLYERESCGVVPGGVVAQDLDGDGDIDLAVHRTGGFPAIFANDDGVFRRAGPVDGDLDLELFGRTAQGVAAVDRDGDGLPEIVVSGESLLVQSRNLGELQFGPWEVLYRDDAYPRSCFNSMSWGDADGDGDLDVLLLGLLGVPFEGWEEDPPSPEATLFGSEDLLLLSGPAGMREAVLPRPEGEVGLAFLGAMTDRDGDGDRDLLVTSDRSSMPGWPMTAMYRNDGTDSDGLPILSNEAADLGINLPIEGMGMGTGDFNDDGNLDYCMTTVGTRLSCLVTDGTSGYIEAGVAMGLQAEVATFDPGESTSNEWIPWSLSLTDLDNDGFRDVAIAAGPTPDLGSVSNSFSSPEHPNALFEGIEPDRFVDRTEDAAFGDTRKQYGLVSADLEGDGFRELIISSYDESPRIWRNPCGMTGWLEVELVGPPENREGWGARVEARSGDWWDMQEMQNLLGVGQEPSRIHFGLGRREVVQRLQVTWPDGTQMLTTDLPVNRVITVTHPDA